MLLDPLKEQFDVPAVFVNSGNGLTRHRKIVGDEDEVLIDIGSVVAHPTYGNRICQQTLLTRQNDGLIATNPSGVNDRSRITPAELEIVFGADNEESQRLIETIQARKVYITSIHYDKAAGFERDAIQSV